MIVYDRLWKTMKEKGITQYRLLKEYGFSAGQLDRLRKGVYVNLYTLNTLCRILNCAVEDIIEYVPEDE